MLNERVLDELDISSGDPAKPIQFRLHNKSKRTLTGVVIDIRFLQPLALSGTNTAISFQPLSFKPGKTIRGRIQDGSYYLIRFTELEIVGHTNLDLKVELNTTNKSPGTYTIIVTVYSTQQDFKYGKEEIQVNIN